MGKLRRTAVLLVVVSIAFLAPTLHSQGTSTSYLILVKSQSPSATAGVAAAVAERGTVVAELGEIGVVAATSSDPDFAAVIGADANVQSVAPDPAINWLPDDKVYPEAVDASAFLVNNEPRAAIQWNMRAIHADDTAAQGDVGNGVARARVAVVDSGIVTTHPDIAANLNLALSTSFVAGEGLNPPPNVFNHGTHVAGIIAAPVNGFGVQGVAPAAEIVAVKVLSAKTGSGSFSQVIAGIEYASGPLVHADVINMSLGATFDRINAGGGGAGPLLAALNRAVNHATARGTLVVSAAGNEALNLDSRIASVPAQSGNGMAVSATAPIGWALDPANANYDLFASYSNYGFSVVNLAAPGGDTAYPGNEACAIAGLVRPCWVFDMVFSPGGYATDANGNLLGYSTYWAAGTSMAAPHVSGVAALIVGKYGHMPPAQLKAMLQQSADDLYKPGADPYSGKGRINALKALQ